MRYSRRTQLKLALLALLFGSFALAQPRMRPTQKVQLTMTQMKMPGALMAPIKSERDFIQGMIPHHQEAVDSARVVAKNSEHPQLRVLAEDVIKTQTGEISELQGWLEAWYPDAPKPSRYAPMMRTLPNATPDEADRAFVEDMVAHHEMAVLMAEQLLAAKFSKHPKTEALARAIVATQTAQVTTLRSWLRSWYGVHTSAG